MENAKNTIRYEDLDRDLPTLKPAERPCVLAGMLCGRLGILSFQAEHLEHDLRVQELLSSKPAEGPCTRAASSVGMAVDLLRRLSTEIADTSTLLALVEIHASEGRKVCVSGKWHGSYCEAALAIGREYYCAISRTADDDEFGEWLLADAKGPRGYEPLPAATIEARWSEIAQAILGLPTVDWDELDLGIRNEWIEVRGNRSNGDGNGDGNGDDPPECYVSLLQMASIVQKSKSTLRRFYDDGGLPPPKIEGGGGSPHEWVWSVVRPILETKYSRTLPVAFPSDRFVKH